MKCINNLFAKIEERDSNFLLKTSHFGPQIPIFWSTKTHCRPAKSHFWYAHFGSAFEKHNCPAKSDFCSAKLILPFWKERQTRKRRKLLLHPKNVRRIVESNNRAWMVSLYYITLSAHERTHNTSQKHRSKRKSLKLPFEIQLNWM